MYELKEIVESMMLQKSIQISRIIVQCWSSPLLYPPDIMLISKEKKKKKKPRKFLKLCLMPVYRKIPPVICLNSLGF